MISHNVICQMPKGQRALRCSPWRGTNVHFFKKKFLYKIKDHIIHWHTTIDILTYPWFQYVSLFDHFCIINKVNNINYMTYMYQFKRLIKSISWHICVNILQDFAPSIRQFRQNFQSPSFDGRNHFNDLRLPRPIRRSVGSKRRQNRRESLPEQW